MTDLELAKKTLVGHTLCLSMDGELITSDKKGIAPMMDLIEGGADLSGYSAADLVVGKAAAMLFARCGIKEVFARTISKPALDALAQYKIPCEYETLVPNIINRAGDDICPMEKTVLHTTDLDEAYALLKDKLTELRNNK